MVKLFLEFVVIVLTPFNFSIGRGFTAGEGDDWSERYSRNLCGIDINIKALANTIAKVIWYQGMIEFDTTKPDGAPRKLMDSNRLKALGWQPRIDLQEGLDTTYQEYLSSLAIADR